MTGAPTPDPFTERQLQAVTRLIDREVTRISSAIRFALAENTRDVRLAKTVERDETYPTTGDTFAIRFVDCGFTPRSPGSSTMTSKERTAEGDTDDADDVIAREINGQYVHEGTYVSALWQRGLEGDPDDYGEWWINLGAGKKRLCRFTLDAALATSEASEEATIVTQYGEGTSHASNDITVYNMLTATASTYLFEGASGAAGLAYYDSGTNWRIIQMECPAA